MKKLEKIRTKNEILELQKNEEITITITKRQAILIGFALGTEKKGVEKLIKDIQEKNITSENKEQQKMLDEILMNSYKDYKELTDMQENLKKFYGVLDLK
jgi:hypothetical protein